VIEALAAGRVVLVSEFAGAHEIIREGANGFVLAREGSPEQIAALLDGPAGRPGSRGPLGEAAVRTAAGFDHDALHSRLRDAHHKAYARRLRCLQEAAA
jgi:glycosyltransferase involved in cell wall biosynthesis